MKQIITVFSFEFLNYIKKKGYIGFTLFVSILVFAGFFGPRAVVAYIGYRLDKHMDTEANGEAENEADIDKYGIIDRQNVISHSMWQSYFPHSEFLVFDNITTLENAVKNDEILCGIVIDDIYDFKCIVNDNSARNTATLISNMLIDTQKQLVLNQLNISIEEIDALYAPHINSETIVLGVDGSANYTFGYMTIMLVYFMIILYGQSVATSVATEKTSKSVEVLLTSVKPASLIVGKVVSAAGAGILQVVIVALSGWVAFMLNRDFYIADGTISDIFAFNLSWSTIALFLIFAILGYFLFSFMIGATAANITEMKDIGSSIQFPLFLMLIGFFVSITYLGINHDDMFLRIASIFPLTSPFAMVARLCITTIPTWEIALSIAILILTIVVTVIFSVKIYTRSIMSSTKVSLFKS
ncbi:MAG: hypothetical protein ATN33_00015 [Epulopiscium sp. Nele67-Bin001]|nr:MAG: hypothetical protein ATN33_00015 [Epulopiscium sp. Nele67-Bin001]